MHSTICCKLIFDQFRTMRAIDSQLTKTYKKLTYYMNLIYRITIFVKKVAFFSCCLKRVNCSISFSGSSFSVSSSLSSATTPYSSNCSSLPTASNLSKTLFSLSRIFFWMLNKNRKCNHYLRNTKEAYIIWNK